MANKSRNASPNRLAQADESEQQLNQMVQAVMVLDYSKKPFRLADVCNLTRNPVRRGWKKFFTELNKKLNSLGLELHEAQTTGQRMVYVTSQFYPMPLMHPFVSDEELANRTLLTIVLAYIFMRNGTVNNDELLRHLRGLNIYDSQRAIHPYFGDVNKIVFTDFPEQLYLSILKFPESETSTVRWGERAEIEVNKRALLEFISECGYGGELKIEQMASHYEKVLLQEAEAAENAMVSSEDSDSD